MRISDWSSDVCSADLDGPLLVGLDPRRLEHLGAEADAVAQALLRREGLEVLEQRGLGAEELRPAGALGERVAVEVVRDVDPAAGRSEERRVGKERVSTCRCRWSPYL